MLNQGQLLYREGWTKTAIDRFLGEPDELVPNWRYKNAAPTKKYSLERIEAAEKTAEFAQFVEKSQKRRASARKAMAVRREKTIEEIKDIEVTCFEDRSIERVKQRAHEVWRKHRRSRPGYDFDIERYEDDSANDNFEEFIDRITVNFLRHKRTNYESVLKQIKGKVGVSVAYSIVKVATLKAIGEKYPELKTECDRQAASHIQWLAKLSADQD